MTRDHPREYGENQRILNAPPAAIGSSPRIRGKSLPSFPAAFVSGIIPANTGKMNTEKALVFSARDHPREYGENHLRPRTSIPTPGSSPRIRGKCQRLLQGVGNVRIIPANTGKMSPTILRKAAAWDHPREYGENPSGEIGNPADMGSSPRIRGKCDHTQ